MLAGTYHNKARLPEQVVAALPGSVSLEVPVPSRLWEAENAQS